MSKLTKSPIDEIRDLIPDYQDLKIKEFEDQIDDLIQFENLDFEVAIELTKWFVKSRVIECYKGKRKPEENILEFIEILEMNSIQSKYNIMTHRGEIIADKWKSQTVIGQAEEEKIYRVEEVVKQYGWNIKTVPKYLKLSATPYHPVYDWITSKEWDGKDRFEDVFTSIDCLNDDLKLAKVYFWKWSIAGCRAILTQDGFVSENILVFKAKQGAGKTRWLTSLAPKGFIKSGLNLNPSNKDSVMEATAIWICELGELDTTTRKADAGALKAFFSKSEDNFRRPYGIAEEIIPRKTIFCASVNNDSFLVDDTGNRRYWILEIGETNNKHGIDMQQYWAQVMATAIKDEELYPHWLDKEESELQDNESEKFRQLDPLCETLIEKIDMLYEEEYTATKILQEIHEIPNPKPHECKVIVQFLSTKKGWGKRPKGKGIHVLVNPNYKLGNKGYEEDKFFQ